MKNKKHTQVVAEGGLLQIILMLRLRFTDSRFTPMKVSTVHAADTEPFELSMHSPTYKSHIRFICKYLYFSYAITQQLLHLQPDSLLTTNAAPRCLIVWSSEFRYLSPSLSGSIDVVMQEPKLLGLTLAGINQTQHVWLRGSGFCGAVELLKTSVSVTPVCEPKQLVCVTACDNN